ncbi:MAG TPA: deoxynucleoside kinase [Bdellovibrionota bacterium]|nr:deoxynucleoside kinase [Bdellovibrionota bacterium]
MTPRYIVVEGPIAVGKSAVVEALRKRLLAKTYLDAPNPFLQSFYDDMEKSALQVQLYFLLTRFQQQRELAQGDLFSSTILCDYLFQKDRLFASLTLGTQEYALYEKVYSLLQGTIATPDAVVYLQADLDTLFERLAAKDEGLALLLPESYLADVVAAYQTFFFHYTDAPVIVCNTARMNLAEDDDGLDLLLKKLGEVKSGVHYLNP